MIELKFRAWNTIVQRMQYFKLEDLENQVGKIQWHILEVMQFTGLKDGKGNPIYNSDLYMTDTGGKNKFWQVFYKNGCWCGGKDINTAIPLAYDNYSADNGDTSWLFVVGNIYENPELLNQ